MKTLRSFPLRPGTSARVALAVAIAATLPVFHVGAADRIKQNNTTALNLAASWDTLPGAGDVGLWNSTVTGANTVAVGGNLSLLGIRIANPGGAVVITNAAGNVLTLGTSGIDLSAATQNLTIFNTANTTGTIAIGGNQTWNVAAGRSLSLFATSNTATEGLTGAGSIQITTAGGAGTMGVVNLNTGDSTSTGFTGGGSAGYSGNWTIGNGGNATGTTAATSVNTGSTVNLRNGANAWGSGTITLNGGQIASTSGNWSWTNAMILNPGTTSNLLLASGASRTLKLNGVISSSGSINFLDNGTVQPIDRGYILTGANTMSGTVSISPGAFVRVGGVAETNASAAGALSLLAGTTGTLGTTAVTNNGTLTLSHSDTWSFNNNVSGTGVVNVGSSLITGSGTQIVTIGGTNTYTGATSVNAGRLNLTGSMTSAIAVGSAATISGTGSTTGLLTLNTGANLVLAGGATTASLTANGATFNASTLSFDITPNSGTVYDVVTYGAGALTTPGNLTTNYRGAFNDDTLNQKYTFTAAGATRTWNTTSGTWDLNTSTNFAEGDQKFLYGDTVVFNDPGSASTVTLTGALSPASVTVSNTANDYTFSGAGSIAGPGGLTKTGAGTLTISTANSFTGNVAINGGVLKLGSGTALGAFNAAVARVAVASGATLDLNGIVFPSGLTIAGSGTSGQGALINSGAAISTAQIQTPNIALSADAAVGGSGDFFMIASGYSANTLTLNGNTLTKTGTNTLGLATTTVTGGTVRVSQGVLSLGVAAGGTGVTADSAAFTLDDVAGVTLSLARASSSIGSLAGGGVNGGNVNLGALTLTTGALGSTAFAGVISGTGSLAKTGTGTFTLTGVNTYTGSTIINQGTVKLTGTGVLVGASGSAADANNIVFGSNTNSGELDFETAAQLGAASQIRFRNTGGTAGLGGNLKYVGTTLQTVSKTLFSDSSIGLRLESDSVGGAVTFDGAFSLGTGGTRPLFLAGSGTGANTLAAPFTNGGVANALTKNGVGTWILSAVNTYTGPTTVNAGTLLVSGSISGSAVSVNGGTLGGSGGTVGTTTVNAGGNFAPGTSIGILNVSGTLTLGGTATFELDKTGLTLSADLANATGLITFGGTLNVSATGDPLINGDTFNLFDAPGFGGSFSAFNLPALNPGLSWNTDTLAVDGTLTVVPEPGAAVSLLGGIGLLLGMRRTRRQQA